MLSTLIVNAAAATTKACYQVYGRVRKNGNIMPDLQMKGVRVNIKCCCNTKTLLCGVCLK